MTTKYKTAKTIKEFRINYRGWEIVVPVGSKVCNETACGCDDNYRFWKEWHKQIEKLTHYKNSMLAHDLTYYGLNVPAEYCEPYSNE
jgi:hypothetical protein